MAQETPTETKLKGQADEVRGNVKKAVGKATGNEELERQGERDKSRGALKKAWGSIKSIFMKH